MNHYTNTEFTNVHFVYGISNGNGSTVVWLYRKKYLTKQIIKCFSGASEPCETLILHRNDTRYQVAKKSQNTHTLRKRVACCRSKSRKGRLPLPSACLEQLSDEYFTVNYDIPVICINISFCSQMITLYMARLYSGYFTKVWLTHNHPVLLC
ncbi:hypothetical protein NPIL_14671 [Nephila pilipes]|uniref:Uncharacterized protein n=1 Tax=Nephila pilipes TaxID=299642 RepID=A0A8X6UGU1_NEPPI|nr:hypothetical protein NPIL_14671 [Nephila pilipes]